MLVPHIDTHGKDGEFHGALDISGKPYRGLLSANLRARYSWYLRWLLPHSRVRTAFCALMAALLCGCVVLSGAGAQDSGATAGTGASPAARADALYRAGIAALQERDLVVAQADFEQVVKLSPRSAEAHNSLGWVLVARQQLDAAIAQFNAALDLRTDFFQAYLNLSSALLQKGDAKDAVRAARQAVRFAPTMPETYRALAHALDATGDVEVAGRAVEGHGEVGGGVGR